jgi:hypothetical protein
MYKSLSHLAKAADDWIWKRLFGTEDYMGLHPPVGLRLRMLARMPVQLIAPETCKRPIFIIGCPRSGTTLLYNLLQRAPELKFLGQESHWIWEYCHPPRQAADHSQVLKGGDVTGRSRRFIRACYGAAFGADRFVDKCPTNALRIDAIRTVFPDAVIIGLTRNGPDNISSLIDTWTDPDRFQGFEVPEDLGIDGYDGDKWVHVLPPGWQQYTNASIEKVCAHQWRMLNRALLNAKSNLPSEKFIRVRYESFFENPVETYEALFDKLGLTWTNEVQSHVRSLDQHVVNTKTNPQLGKWRTRNPRRVSNVLGEIEPVMNTLGYSMPNPEKTNA